MANLIRLLVALPADDLRALAEHWGVVVEPEQRSLVARLYHEMTSEWPVKTIWETLGASHRVILEFVLNQRDFLAGRHLLLHELPLDAAALARATGELSQLGLIAFRAAQRDYGFRSVPPTSASTPWEVYVPLDLGRVLREVRRQANQGRHTPQGLRKMLIARELSELVQLAARWNTQQPERFFKRELVGVLEGLLTDRDAVHGRLRLVPPEGKALYLTVVEAGGRLTLCEAGHRCRLEGPALRTAFEALNGLFLLHETYVDGERTLYVPGEVLRGERPMESPIELPTLAVVSRPPVSAPREPMFLGDLEKLLEKVAGRRMRPHSRGRASQLSPGLPESVTLTPELVEMARECCVQHYAIRLGLVEISEGLLCPTQLIPSWQRLSDGERLRAALQVWASEDRCFCLSTGDHLKPSVPLPALRRLLADTLREAQPGAWYSLNTLARRLRTQFRLISPNAAYPDLRLATTLSLLGLGWFGLLSLGLSNDGKVISLQLLDTAEELLSAIPAPTVGPSSPMRQVVPVGPASHPQS